MNDEFRTLYDKVALSITSLPGTNSTMHFSKTLGPDITDPNVYKTLDDLCTALMHPPHDAFKHEEGRVRISMEWVLRTVGEDHFIYNNETHMRNLHPLSKIATHGEEWGLPQTYFNWLFEHPSTGSNPDLTNEWTGVEIKHFKKNPQHKMYGHFHAPGFRNHHPPAPHAEFSNFPIPMLPPPPVETLVDVISRLMHPPDQPFPPIGAMVIDIRWAVSVIGAQNFDNYNGHYVLRHNSLVRQHGLHLGLPFEYWAALCGMPSVIRDWNAPYTLVMVRELWLEGFARRNLGGIRWAGILEWRAPWERMWRMNRRRIVSRYF
ncbi:hypothetical protein EJ04DRAFT_518636 [Polyplosphaeria fusca]|uniref:Uncharacterized protein n=1 Tax=Polyplosphaeria fusca TaxID=682080 RepID=A0A9P4RB85_9PLEO|nr:hypothetical protein EJ04DRAFT_518636 [Polyplosphaeria fusca]